MKLKVNTMMQPTKERKKRFKAIARVKMLKILSVVTDLNRQLVARVNKLQIS